MAHYIGRISELFNIECRGVVVAIDTPYYQLPDDLHLRVGVALCIHGHAGLVIQTHLAGIEHCDPWTPTSCFSFLLPADIKLSDLAIGYEVWTLEKDGLADEID